MATCSLYLITPPTIEDLALFASRLDETLAAGGVAALQVRLKGATDEEIAAAVKVLIPVCHGLDVALILNDRPDLASDLGCDGVHIGQQDGPAAEARRRIGEGRLLGVTCHASRHLAMVAAEEGADYVAFGAFFASATKSAPARAEPDILRVWSETTNVRCVAIGGIDASNCRALAAAGADFLAVCGGVWSHADGPVAAVRAINREIAAALSRD